MVIALLGRQPSIGLAELESLAGSKNVQPLDKWAAMVEHELDGQRLGGTIKLLRPLTELASTKWEDIEAHFLNKLPHHLEHLPPGKLRLGISAYGLAVKPQQLFKSGLELKKIARLHGRAVRIVPPKESALSSAQVFH